MFEVATNAQTQAAFAAAHAERAAVFRNLFAKLFKVNSAPLAPTGLTVMSR